MEEANVIYLKTVILRGPDLLCQLSKASIMLILQ